jgi:hypothetical protein
LHFGLLQVLFGLFFCRSFALSTSCDSPRPFCVLFRFADASPVELNVRDELSFVGNSALFRCTSRTPEVQPFVRSIEWHIQDATARNHTHNQLWRIATGASKGKRSSSFRIIRLDAPALKTPPLIGACSTTRSVVVTPILTRSLEHLNKHRLESYAGDVHDIIALLSAVLHAFSLLQSIRRKIVCLHSFRRPRIDTTADFLLRNPMHSRPI